MTAGTDGDRRRVIDFEGFPGRWEVRKTAEDTDGERFETRMEIEEQSELPPHIHPEAEESYEVLSGVLEVQVDGEWTELTAGEAHTVPPGTVHSFRNESPVEVINVHSPALRYEEFFRTFQRLKTERGVSMPPSGFRATVLLAMLVSEYKREQVVASPPQWVFDGLAALGRVLGYRLPD
ncbi:MAG TPA: cupin domain-containing protein [Halobacteriales archaeon]|nr:cupin domain-containing protein [Halobacteriales archaeon]